jgi:hypothetical protein
MEGENTATSSRTLERFAIYKWYSMIVGAINVVERSNSPQMSITGLCHEPSHSNMT